MVTPSTLQPYRPTCSVRPDGGTACTTTLLVDAVTWEPYGGIKAYEIDAPSVVSSSKAAVQYFLGNTTNLATSCPTQKQGEALDGRLGSLWFQLAPIQWEGMRPATSTRASLLGGGGVDWASDLPSWDRPVGRKFHDQCRRRWI